MVKVLVNGSRFDLFKQIDVSRSFEEFSGEARIVTSQQVDNNNFIRLGDLVQVFVDDYPIVCGYAEKVTDNESIGSHDLSYTFRDKVQDLIDSSVPDNVKNVKKPATFKQLCQLVIQGLGFDIQVIDNTNAKITGDIKCAKTGEKCEEFLMRIARQCQVFLNSDSNGNILIRRPNEKIKTMLCNVKDFNKNNIKDSNISMDWSQRYYKYIIRSNGNLSEFDWDTNVTSNVNFKGVAYDNEIRQTRTFEKIAQHILSNTECQKMAVEESNIRRAKSLTYQATVAGFSANGELWQEGKLVSVKDDKKKIYGNFVIKSVHYLYSTAGEITTMDMTYPDAFQLEDSLSDSNQRVVNIGSYTVSKGDTLHDIAKSKNISLQDLISANPQIKNPDLIYPDQTIKIPKGQ